ncbi:VOC family protein, partial [Streptomyces sp. NPDC005004]
SPSTAREPCQLRTPPPHPPHHPIGGHAEKAHCDIAMLRTPDGHSRIELAKYRSPEAIDAGPRERPHNILGTHRVMFAVDDIEDTVARLRPHGAELMGEIARFEDSYLLCYLRGPEGVIVALAEQLG